MSIYHRCCFLVSVLLSLVSSVIAAERYTIQIGAYETAAAAEAAALSAEAYADPVHVFEGEGTHPWKVTLGEFEFYAGAWAVKEKLNRPELTGCFIARRDIARPQRNEQLPVDEPFTLNGFPDRPRNRVPIEELQPLEYMRSVGLESNERLPAELSGAALASLDNDQLYRVGVSDSDNARGISALQTFISNAPTDPRVNRARLRLAKRLMRTDDFTQIEQVLTTVEGEQNEELTPVCGFLRAYVVLKRDGKSAAIDDFAAVAGDMTVPAALRRDAMRRVARAMHSTGDPAGAWLAFERILESAPDRSTQAWARMQMAGLAIELAGRGKGTLAEGRELAERAAAMPGIAKRDRATALLMRLETLFNERRYEGLPLQIDAYLAEFSDIRRECLTARVLKGTTLLQTGDEVGARAVFEAVAAEENVAARDMFGSEDQRARALGYLCQLCVRHGDEQGYTTYMGELTQRFPGSRHRTEALEYYETEERLKLLHE